jgi:hypothetical protein
MFLGLNVEAHDRYQNMFRIIIWLFFLFVYSQAGQYWALYAGEMLWQVLRLFYSTRAAGQVGSGSWRSGYIWDHFVYHGAVICDWRYLFQIRIILPSYSIQFQPSDIYRVCPPPASFSPANFRLTDLQTPLICFLESVCILGHCIRGHRRTPSSCVQSAYRWSGHARCATICGAKSTEFPVA